MRMKKIIVALLLLLASFAAAAQNTTNIPVTLLPSLARSATTVTTVDQTNTSFTKVSVIINVSAYTSGNYTPHIEAKDPVSGVYYDLLVGSAINTTSTSGPVVLYVGAGVLATPNVAAAAPLPRTWRLRMAGASSPVMTFSVGAFLGN
jgi:hypothetical protein